jgi:protein required for attachment to host cells
MQLPQSFRAFQKPTLIVATDSVQAKIYKAYEHTIEHVETISRKADVLGGEREAVKTGAGDMRSAEPENDSQDWSREQLYDALSQNLMHRLQNGEFEELALMVPEENKNDLEDSLHINLLKRITVTIPKMLTNEEPLDLAAHVQEEM